MKYTVYKHQVESFGIKKNFYIDITQTGTFTTELLKPCYLLILFLSTDNNISPHISLRNGEG